MARTPKNIIKSRDSERVQSFIAQALKQAREEYKASEMPQVKISWDNRKTNCPSFSTLPKTCCPAICRGTCDHDCYAENMISVYGYSTALSWARNFVAWIHNPDAVFAAIDATCKVSKYFRYHVSGDIINADYFRRMVKVARDNPGTHFLAFTKAYDIVNAWIDKNGDLPENLQIIFSEGWGIKAPNPHNLPRSYVWEKGEEFNEDWKTCGGDCMSCACRGLGCWTLKKGEIVAFAKH